MILIYIYVWRRFLVITWQKYIPDTEVLTRASLPSIYIILIQSQVREAGHVVRMKDYCLSKKLLHSEQSQSKRSQEGQIKRFKNTQKISMKSFRVTPNYLDCPAEDRDKWREVEGKSVNQEGML